MPSFKLTYFDFRARGEIARLLFAAGGQTYEDHRITFAQWPPVKPTTPWGSLPVLEVDGKQLGDSLAIADYLAVEFGLMGKTKLEAANIRSIVYQIHGMKEPAIPLFFVKDKAEQEKKVKEFMEGKVQPVLPKLEVLPKGQDTWLAGTAELSWADLHLYDTLEILQCMEPSLLEAFPGLQAACKKVEGHPGVARWLRDRKQEGQKLKLNMV